MFERVIVAVLANPRKAPLLDAETRIRVIRDALAVSGVPDGRVEVEAFDGLTVDLCRARGAGSIVRGLRAISDFETEMQLAPNNRVLAPRGGHGLFMTAVRRLSEPSCQGVAALGCDVSSMLPPAGIAGLDGRSSRR